MSPSTKPKITDETMKTQGKGTSEIRIQELSINRRMINGHISIDFSRNQVFVPVIAIQTVGFIYIACLV
ncbi:MAG: hypothetical protein WAJ93_01500, partial [Candidatus Nitrosopolaris sp.]